MDTRKISLERRDDMDSEEYFEEILKKLGTPGRDLENIKGVTLEIKDHKISWGSIYENE